MYINVYKILLLVCMCGIGIFWISCSGNSDDSEETEVLLNVSKNTLIADGKDVITFTVTHAGVDITADAVIRSVMDGQILDGSTFSTSKVGMYAFEASYGKYVSKLITVIAREAPGTPSKFVRRICAMEFTGTWCAMCPAGMTRLNYLISSSYEGVVYLMSFHVDGTSADPMTIEQSSLLSRKFSISSYPSCVVEGIYRDYTHNHVVRKLLSATVDGDKLGHIAAGKEKSISYTVIMEEGWNAENLSFYALVTDENGYVNNLAVCKAIDGDADYEYVND